MVEFSDVFDAVICEIRTRHYSIRTEQSYVAWLVHFILLHKRKPSERMAEAEIVAYLTHLAVNRMISSSTQCQALNAINAIIFLYKPGYKREIGQLNSFILVKKILRLPVVLSRNEIQLLIQGIDDDVKLLHKIDLSNGMGGVYLP